MTISIQSISIYRDNYSNRVQLVHSPALGAPVQKIQAPEWTSSHSYPAAICPGLHTSGDPAVEVTFQTTTPRRGSIRIGASVAVGDQLFALAPKSVQFLSLAQSLTGNTAGAQQTARELQRQHPQFPGLPQLLAMLGLPR